MVSACYGQTNSPWRFWDVADGLDESYTNGMAPGPNGEIWVKHGAVGHMDRTNGYSARSFPDPGGIGKIESAPDGTLWLWTNNQLKRFDGSSWTSYNVDAVTALGVLRTNSFETWVFTSRSSNFWQSNLILIPLDRNRVLIMLPDRILEFDAAKSKTRLALSVAQTSLKRFGGFRATAGGAIYLSGRGGAGRIHADAAGIWYWDALATPPSPYVDFEEPIASPGGGLLLTGITLQGSTAALSFDGHRWRALYKGTTRGLRAWPGASGTVWVQDGDHVMELTGGGRRPADRHGALSGILLSIMPESPGRFWVTSSQGIAHYMTPLWQTPPEAPLLDDVVNAIAEDRSGKLWFLAAHELVCFDNTAWSSYPLPKGMTAWATVPGLGVLADGSLAIRTTGQDLLVFNPVRHAFHVVKHPQGRRLRLFLAQPDGTLLVETFAPGSHLDGAIEVFDGRTFRPFLKPPSPWSESELRTLQVGPSGEIWAGGMDFFGVLRGSRFHVHGAKTGFGDPAGYAVHVDRAGQVTAGGRDGLYRLEGDRWRLIQAGLDRVRSIITTREGVLWVASGTGVHRYKNGVLISNGEEEGLPSSVAYMVFEDSRGRVWAGTTRGVSLFNPEADTEAPKPILTENQNQHEAPPGGRIRIVFSGVDRWKFTLPSRLLFSYRLDMGAWTAFAPGRSASYDKLPAGPHRFEVRAMDRGGNISAASAVHRFSVLLPWYATTGFRWSAAACGSLIALLLTLAWLSYSHRGRLIRALHRKGQLERDSQTILRMIAGREPLPLILQRIAVFASGGAGATCIVFRDNRGALDCFPAPAMPEELQAPIQRMAAGQWWEDLVSMTGNPSAGTCLAVAVRSGGGERLGAIALFRTNPDTVAGAGTWLETFGDLAAAAIENARLYERLEYQARHDALTGLPNRLYFEDRLQASVSTAKASGDRLAVLYIDLDRFKQINDTMGHRVGDLFLKLVAARLSGVMKTGQTLCRIGGDEFTVLVDRAADKPALEALAADMLAVLRIPIALEGQKLSAGASIGIAVFPEHGETPSTLQKHADSAMYRAKAAGRNRVEFFSAELLSSTAAAMNIEQMLHRALDEDLFELHYQPQFTLTGEVAGMEALLRMRDAKGDLISPADFIPLAEETGLIVPIGAWVLHEACRQLREWLDEGLQCSKIAINVSALQIARPSFADEVAAVLVEMRIDPRLLELELTESAIMGNLVESKRQMEKLRALGVGIAVDDFGTGYSSLSYLQNLPIDVLKIDRSFVQAITGHGGGLPMVQAILALARNLGLTVVAEGVETESQLTALRDSRCDFLQGFLFCRPQPAAEVRAYLGKAGLRPVAETREYEYAL
jgi:diguanylate cyclase (GGDEF)-like protein